MEATAAKVTFQKYPAYKDSGVEWLGEIPEHWDLLANKFVFNLKKNLVGKKSSEYTLLSLTLKGIIQRDLDNGGKFPAEFDTYQEVKKGDFIFCLFDVEETPRCVGLSDFEGMITGAYTVMEVNQSFDKAFLYYFYLNLDADKRMRPLYTGLRNTISKDNFFAFKTFVPPKEEQTAIAAFLDDKTAKIDRAITQKEQLIALLKERKQIVIQDLVTGKKVWNEKQNAWTEPAEVKESGVEWIGEIPEGWEVKRLKFVLKSPLKYGANESGIEYSPMLPRYIRITDFSMEGKLNDEKKLSLSWEIGRQYLLEDGDILFARSGATVGKSYQFKKSMSLETHYSFAGYLIKASPNEKIILSDYLNYYTMTGSFENWKSFIFNKATIENIGADKYSELRVVIPPILDQTAIITHIETQSSKIDKALQLQEQQIEKLKELKSTLIDSAVTGKVRVY